MNIAIVGCGYVAEFYAKTLNNYPDLKLVGVCDVDEHNLQSFCRQWSVRSYADLQLLLDDGSVEIVLNLTNPRSHFEITRRCIAAGKHVYSEKPLAMDSAAARALVDLAERGGVYLACAPCSVLGEAAQSAWKALREGAIGRVRLIYGNFDDGMIAPRQTPWLWRNETGVPWPAKDEFEVGCTYEHAGYLLTWLAAFFGPARRVTAFASCLHADKGITVDVMAPDFVVGCIDYGDDVTARITCSLLGPKDKSLTIMGDEGVLTVPDVRNDVCPVYVRRVPPSRMRGGIERRLNDWRRLLRFPGFETDWHLWQRYPLAASPRRRLVGRGKPVDFCRGPAELAAAIREKRPCRLSARLGWHVTELVESLQYPERFGYRRELASTFDSIEPFSNDA